MNFKKTALLIGCSLFSMPAIADRQECQFSVFHDIEIVQQKLVFQNDKQNLTFTPTELFINGELASLTSQQSTASQALYQKTLKLVPKISEIAIEGAELGIKVATLVITSLFGSGEDVHKDLIAPIEELSKKIRDQVTSSSINTGALLHTIDEEVDQELEGLLSRAMSQYASKMAGQLISRIFSGDNEEIEDLEFKMENLEHQIETYVESHSDGLEGKANALCSDLDQLAQLDSVLEDVQGYPLKGLIRRDSGGRLNISSID